MKKFVFILFIEILKLSKSSTSIADINLINTIPISETILSITITY